MTKPHTQDPRTWVTASPLLEKPLLKGIPKRNLEHLMRERGLENKDVAQMLGMGVSKPARNRIYEWKKGRRNLPDERLIQLADVLKVAPLYLLDLTEVGDEQAEGGIRLPSNAQQLTATGMRQAMQRDLEILAQGFDGPTTTTCLDYESCRYRFEYYGTSVDFNFHKQATPADRDAHRERGDIVFLPIYLGCFTHIGGDYRDLGHLAEVATKMHATGSADMEPYVTKVLRAHL